MIGKSTTALIFLGFFSGILSECNETRQSPQSQWFMYYGPREMPNGLLNPLNLFPTEGTENLQNNALGITAAGNRGNRLIAQSLLPLVSLGGQQYYFQTYFKANFFKAFQFCAGHGMNLLSIESLAENNNIVNYIRQNLKNIDRIWIAGTDMVEQGDFVWLTTGKEMNFTHWSAGQPDALGKERCLQIWHLKEDKDVGTWNNINCLDYSYYFVCELPECSSFCT